MAAVQIFACRARAPAKGKAQPATAPAPNVKRDLVATVERAGDALRVTDPHGLAFVFAPEQFPLAQSLLSVPPDDKMTLVFKRPDGSTVERDSGARTYFSAADILGLIYCRVV